METWSPRQNSPTENRFVRYSRRVASLSTPVVIRHVVWSMPPENIMFIALFWRYSSALVWATVRLECLTGLAYSRTGRRTQHFLIWLLFHFRSLATFTPSSLKVTTLSISAPLSVTSGGGCFDIAAPMSISFVSRALTIMPVAVDCCTSCKSVHCKWYY